MIFFFSPAAALNRYGFSADHRFVDRAVAPKHDPIYGHLLAGAHAEAVADLHQIEWNVSLTTLVVQPLRGLWREAKQCANRTAGLAASTQLHNLAEKNQRDDNSRRLEIHLDLLSASANRRRLVILAISGLVLERFLLLSLKCSWMGIIRWSNVTRLRTKCCERCSSCCLRSESSSRA